MQSETPSLKTSDLFESSLPEPFVLGTVYEKLDEDRYQEVSYPESTAGLFLLIDAHSGSEGETGKFSKVLPFIRHLSAP